MNTIDYAVKWLRKVLLRLEFIGKVTTCPECGGHGGADLTGGDTCRRCNGAGTVLQ